MKSLNTKLPAVAAPTLAALCASSMWAAVTGAQTGGSQFHRLADATGAEGYDLQWRDGRVVGLRALRQDGSWLDLRPYVPPTDDAGEEARHLRLRAPCKKELCGQGEEQRG